MSPQLPSDSSRKPYLRMTSPRWAFVSTRSLGQLRESESAAWLFASKQMMAAPRCAPRRSVPWCFAF